LCGAHCPVICSAAEIRHFPIAHFATTNVFFALAQFLRKRKKEPAFQASSPKNFARAGFDRPSFFADASRASAR
jgi:hypothetical protein